MTKIEQLRESEIAYRTSRENFIMAAVLTTLATGICFAFMVTFAVVGKPFNPAFMNFLIGFGFFGIIAFVCNTKVYDLTKYWKDAQNELSEYKRLNN